MNFIDSKLLTIVFVDIQNYTKLSSILKREELISLINKAKNTISKVIPQFNGKLIKTLGDGFILSFDSATNAVICSLNLIQQISYENTFIPDINKKIHIRIGICTGEVSLDNNGDVFGDTVNLAARIQSIAEPDSVFLSESTFMAMNKNEVNAIDMGLYKLKNVENKVRIYKAFTNKHTSTNVYSQISKQNLKYHSIFNLVFILLVIFITISYIIYNKYFTKKAPITKYQNIFKLHSETTNQEDEPFTSSNEANIDFISKEHFSTVKFEISYENLQRFEKIIYKKSKDNRIKKLYSQMFNFIKNKNFSQALPIAQDIEKFFANKNDYPSSLELVILAYVYYKNNFIDKTKELIIKAKDEIPNQKNLKKLLEKILINLNN